MLKFRPITAACAGWLTVVPTASVNAVKIPDEAKDFKFMEIEGKLVEGKRSSKDG